MEVMFAGWRWISSTSYTYGLRSSQKRIRKRKQEGLNEGKAAGAQHSRDAFSDARQTSPTKRRVLELPARFLPSVCVHTVRIRIAFRTQPIYLIPVNTRKVIHANVVDKCGAGRQGMGAGLLVVFGSAKRTRGLGEVSRREGIISARGLCDN
ncbi:hypothetical protein K504DRAFT_447616 [Pleomassaria siparia CBS 279.74]|uniref:Uncharacterized protein n=1 Tax=Pleomassaria siparia CBS 279.74 TaxID=1314801 RepID=A0A6G1K2U3_9PLEO|nr:hypothetical protein K504DRAFT_447616 [Pleomassaria siparia CBS 279.74]